MSKTIPIQKIENYRRQRIKLGADFTIALKDLPKVLACVKEAKPKQGLNHGERRI